jgi:hypothetical protein
MTDTGTAADLIAEVTTTDQLAWLTQGDRAEHAVFQRRLDEHHYDEACAWLLAWLYRSEAVRRHLELEAGPIYGTGQPPDLDVAFQKVAIAHGGLLERETRR